MRNQRGGSVTFKTSLGDQTLGLSQDTAGSCSLAGIVLQGRLCDPHVQDKLPQEGEGCALKSRGPFPPSAALPHSLSAEVPPITFIIPHLGDLIYNVAGRKY